MEKEHVNTMRVETVKRSAVPRSGTGRDVGSKYDEFFKQAAIAGSRNAAKIAFGSREEMRLAYIGMKQVAKYRKLAIEIHQRGLSVYGWAK